MSSHAVTCSSQPLISGLGQHFSSPRWPQDKRKTQSIVLIPGQCEWYEWYLAQLRNLLKNKQLAQEVPSLNVTPTRISQMILRSLMLIPMEMSLHLLSCQQRNSDPSLKHWPNALIHAGRVFFPILLPYILVIMHTPLGNGLRIFPRCCRFALTLNVHERLRKFCAYFLIVSWRITAIWICLSDICEVSHQSIS